MSAADPVVVGVDVGTGGVRAIAATAAGQVLAAETVSLPPALPPGGQGWHEQDPAAWWQAACQALRRLAVASTRAGVPAAGWRALAVDGTSGTLVCVDADLEPVRPGIMYNDARAEVEASSLNDLAGDFCGRMGYRFAASYALAKARWVQRHEPAVFARTRYLLHQADYIAACLLEAPPATDYSNALKTGYDLLEERWPAWLAELQGVLPRLPAVVAPGRPLGEVTPRAAAATGLPAGLPVIAGATDGTASVLASGVRRVGDYNTTLGTTLVFKAVGERLVSHPQGLIYSHKLPGSRWLPGAASNTGSEWIGAWFPGQPPAALDLAAAERVPVPLTVYPLARRGERFPFLAPDAVGLLPPETEPLGSRYAACLQGTACVERLAYETIDAAAGLAGGDVFATGGGSRSDVWNQVRADVTGRTIHRPACPESAFGSAVLAAAGVTGADLWGTAGAMVRVEASYTPNSSRAAAYSGLYAQLLGKLRERGWR